MSSILFSRTFFIIAGMLAITALTSLANKAFETKKEIWLTIIATFVSLFAVMIFADFFPVNLILVGIFSALLGWEIGPTIEFYGKRFKLKKFMAGRGADLKNRQAPSEELQAEFERELAADTHANEWHKIVFQAISATALAVFATAGLVFFTQTDFGFLGRFLWIALSVLIFMGVFNLIFFHSRIVSLIYSYFGVIIFVLYLLFDFNQLEKMAKDETWSAAVIIAVNIYLDIINLFLNLLAILSDSSD